MFNYVLPLSEIDSIYFCSLNTKRYLFAFSSDTLSELASPPSFSAECSNGMYLIRHETF